MTRLAKVLKELKGLVGCAGKLSSASTRQAARPSRRPVLEELEPRLAPTVTMYPEVRGPNFNTYIVEVIQIDSSTTPINITLNQSSGQISVRANTEIVNKKFPGSPSYTARPYEPALFDTTVNPVQFIEIDGHNGKNNSYTIEATVVPVTLTSGANDIITVGKADGGVQSILGSITIQGSAGGSTLTVNNQADTGGRLVILDAPGAITGLAPAAISYAPAQVSAVTLLLGSGADNVIVAGTSVATSLSAGGNATINVNPALGQGFAGALNVLGGAGRPTLNIIGQEDATPHDVRLSTGPGNGTAATLTGVTPAPVTFNKAQTAAVNLKNLSWGSNLTVDGADDSTDRTVNLFGGTITGLIPATITYDATYLAYVQVHSGAGAETVNVLDSGLWNKVPLTVFGHSGSTTVNVGNSGSVQGFQNGSVQGIQGSLTVTNTFASGTTLNINDWADPANRTANLDTVAVVGVPWPYGTINNLAPGSISYRTSAVRSVNLLTGTGSETINVRSAKVPLNIIGRSAGTAVIIGSQDGMNGITAPVTFTGGGLLRLDDSADPASHTVTFRHEVRTSYVISGLAPANIFYTPSLNSLVLATGTGVETVNIQALAVPNFQEVAHSNSTTINVGVGSVQNVQTSLHVGGAVTPNGTWTHPHLVVDDSADTSRQNLTVIPVVLPYGNSYSFLPLNFVVPTQMIAGFSGLTIFASAFVDMTSIALKTGLGGATVTGGAVAPTTLTGSPSASNTLNTGPGTWTLSGPNAGSGGLLSFTGFGNLNGNSGNVTFVFQKGASVSGTLNGGGNDTLDYTPYVGNVVVNLQTSQATGVGHLAGSFGTVIGASGGGAVGVYNILVGNGGILKGGNGRTNLLIAGPKGTTLLGGDGDDILIAGSTAYDQQTNSAALIAVMNEWSRTDETYDKRIANLTKGIGVPRLDYTTVTSNHARQQVNGGAALDLFFANPSYDATDQKLPEMLVWLL